MAPAVEESEALDATSTQPLARLQNSESFRNLKTSITKALELQHGLGQNLQFSLDVHQATGDKWTRLEFCLSSARRCLDDLEPNPAASSPEKLSSEAAWKLFNTAEVMETIFTFLPVGDLLRVQRVNRTMRDVVLGSIKLQRRMLLSPSKDGHFRVLNISSIRPGTSTHVATIAQTPKFHQLENNYRVTVRAVIGPRTARLGSRVRGMQLSQPPVFSMEYAPSCCDLLSRDRRAVSNEHGLTLGDLFNVAETLRSAHRFCALSRGGSCDKNGLVQVSVSFTGSVTLEADHPWILSCLKKKQARDEHAAKLKEYHRVARDAEDRGETIPTYKEFKATLTTV